MNSERWQQINDLFEASAELEPVRRAAFLDQYCANDPELRREVESLLASDATSWEFIETPALEVASPLFVDEDPQLSSGQNIGRYEVLSFIGRGGMGEVYLVKDEKLNRRIALKLLPLAYTKDKDRLRRFEQEARAASALNQPNILTIHELGEVDGQHFIATEFVEGETLRALLKTGAMSLGEALDIAIQVARALAAAHATGIVHRDIKPENIMLRPDGYVKVLDFGLAKLTEQREGVFQAPTTDESDASSDLIMGTVKYMSPEQASAKSVDRRSDIFSLGVVLYEMITGRVPFRGQTNADLIAAILAEDPAPLTQYLAAAPAELQRIVSKVLSKAREDRYQSASDLVLELEGLRQDLQLESKIQRAVESGGMRTTLPSGASLTRRRLPKSLVVLLTVAGVLGSGYIFYRLIRSNKSANFEKIRVTRVTTSGRAASGVISPDGQYVAYLENDDGGTQGLWIRQIATSTNRLLASRKRIQEGVTFSPDGNHLYYVARPEDDVEPAIYRIPTLGGVPSKVMTGMASSIALSPDGSRIAFLRDQEKESVIMIANIDGSGVRRLAARQFPSEFNSTAWSPDSKRLACAILDTDDAGNYGYVIEIDVESGDQRPITDRRWASLGKLAWLSDGSALMMVAYRKDDSSFMIWKVSFPGGAARPVTSGFNDYSGVSMTKDSATMVSAQGMADFNIFVRPAGDVGEVARITSGSAARDGWCGVAWTPDGSIVYSSEASGHPDIWSMRPDGSDKKQLTVGLGSLSRGLSVSPDGRYIVFISRKGGRQHVWRVDRDGGNAKQLTDGTGEFNPFFAGDSLWVFYRDNKAAWKVPVDGGQGLELSSPFSELLPGGISPDARMIATKSREFPTSPRQTAITSIADGRLIRNLDATQVQQWAPDGRALTYHDKRSGAANFWEQPLDGSVARQLTSFKEREYSIHAFAWSRDGKYLAFSRGTQKKDIVLITSID